MADPVVHVPIEKPVIRTVVEVTARTQLPIMILFYTIGGEPPI